MSTLQIAAAVERPVTRRRRRPLPRLVAWLALIVFLLVTLFPFYWMLRIALSDNGQLAPHAGSLLPVGASLGAFRRVLGLTTIEQAQAQGGSGASIDFGRALWNSVLTSTVITIGQTFFSAMAAYAFARLRWRGREVVFFAFLTALMVPPIFTALPNFVLMRQLGLVNTYAGIILPFFFMTPFAVFFLRQFFLGISREIEEAAIIDGAGHTRRFFQVVLPMATPPLATLAILVYITSWNEYFWPLLVGQDQRVRVLTVALGVFRSQTPSGSPDWSGLMAATLLAALPVVLLFLAFARRIVDTIQFSGIK